MKKPDLLSHWLPAASGQSFLRPLITLSTVAKGQDGFVRLNISSARYFLHVQQWNGCSMLYKYQWANPQVEVSTKEMIPIVMAAMVLGGQWRGLSVQLHTDNSAVVALVNTGSVWDDYLMHLMRCFSFISANVIFFSQHFTFGVKTTSIQRHYHIHLLKHIYQRSIICRSVTAILTPKCQGCQG